MLKRLEPERRQRGDEVFYKLALDSENIAVFAGQS